MASSYKPYPIYSMKSGLRLDVDPWLLPQDAFANMNNCFLLEGRLRKRRGYSLLWKFVHGVDDEVIANQGSFVDGYWADGYWTDGYWLPITDTFTGTLAHYPIRAGDLEITDGVETFTDNGDGTLTGDAGGSGTINYTTGVFSVTFNANPIAGQDITATYDYYPGNPVMGLWNYITESGTDQLILFDTRRMNYYDDVNQKLVDATRTDEFSGYDYNFFWVTNWQNTAYICNGKDRVKTWDGSTLADLLIDTDGDGNNNVTYATFIVAYKSRLVLLKIEDDGHGKFQRARWGLAGTEDFSGDEFVDAPVNEWIVCAGFLRDELVVWFERSIWALRYTGSERLPFRWVRLAAQEGAIAALSLIEFSDEQLAMGNISVTGFDGRDAYNLAPQLSNYVLNMNQAKLDYCYAGVNEENRQAWFTFASIDSDRPDKILAFNYEENSWSIFSLAMMCFGYFNELSAPTWDDMDVTWDSQERTWDMRDFQAGFPRIIGGDYYGNIYWLEYGSNDNGSDIAAEALTGRWNPFSNSGASCRCAWVDLLVERDANIELQVDFYVESKISAPAVTQTVNFGGDRGTETGENVWVRVECGLESNFIQMKLSHTASEQTFVIHAIVPYFKSVGGLR